MTTLARAVAAIERHGALLVYPVQNRPDPLSLWHVLHPKRQMRWAWDDSADPRVVELWHLRERLAQSRRVVYSKWLGGRATFFSKDLFRAMVATLRAEHELEAGLSASSRELLELLREDSPRATRSLREAAGLEGRLHETAYNRALRALWERLLIVGAGEMEEGGFPSLAVGATDLLFEPLWTAAETRRAEDDAILERAISELPSFARAWRRLRKNLEPREL